MLLLIAMSTFASVSLLVIGLTMKSERDLVRERIRMSTEPGAPQPSSVQVDLEAAFRDRVLLPMLSRLADMVSRFTPVGAVRQVDEKLDTAGRPWNLLAGQFIGLKVLSLIVFTLVALGVAGLVADSPLMRLLLLALVVFVGAILPDYLLQRRTTERQTKIRKVLADTLDLLTVSVEAGLGLYGAMQKVVEKLKGPLSDEMDRALKEMQVGKDRTEALKDMARRVKVLELSTFVAAICQAEQLGVSVSKVMRVQGDTLRTQRSQRARESAAKLPVKMLFPLVFFIFPAIFVVIAGPAAIRLVSAFGLLK